MRDNPTTSVFEFNPKMHREELLFSLIFFFFDKVVYFLMLLVRVPVSSINVHRSLRLIRMTVLSVIKNIICERFSLLNHLTCNPIPNV